MLKKLAREVAIYGAGDLALRLIGFLVFPVYAHLFSVEEFGVLALITATTGVVALLASPGLTMAMTRYYWDPEVPPQTRPVAVSSGLPRCTSQAMRAANETSHSCWDALQRLGCD